MASFLRVRSLSKYQHYRDRNPPWVKLHRDLLEDYDFEQLPDVTKAHALLLLLLASRLENEIPNDADWIARKIGARSKVDIAKLLESRFLETCGADCEQHASDAIAESKQVALLEGEREGETEKRESRGKATALPKPAALGEVEFDGLWAVCAKKVGKARARKAYLRLRKAGQLPELERIRNALMRLQQTEQWTKQGRQYQPHLEAWLNRGGWDDEIPKTNGDGATAPTARVCDRCGGKTYVEIPIPGGAVFDPELGRSRSTFSREPCKRCQGTGKF